MPARVDFTGGFTDVAPILSDGCALHVSATLSSGVLVRMDPRSVASGFIIKHFDGSREEELGPFSSIDEIPMNWALVKAAIDQVRLACGLSVTIRSAVPYGVGLGSSGALGVGLVAALLSIEGQMQSTDRIARLAVDAELASGNLCGCQDQMAAAYGGMNEFRCEQSATTRRSLGAPESHARLDEALIVVRPSGTRSSGTIVRRVVARWLNHDTSVRSALRALNELAPAIASAVDVADLVTLASLIDTVGRLQEQLDPLIFDSRIAWLVRRLRKHEGMGVKMLGGGGNGGCALIVCDPALRPKVLANVREAGCTTLHARLGTAGLHASSPLAL